MNARECMAKEIMDMVQDLCFAVHKDTIGQSRRNIEDIRLDIECKLKKLADPGYLVEDVPVPHLSDYAVLDN